MFCRTVFVWACRTDDADTERAAASAAPRRAKRFMNHDSFSRGTCRSSSRASHHRAAARDGFPAEMSWLRFNLLTAPSQPSGQWLSTDCRSATRQAAAFVPLTVARRRENRLPCQLASRFHEPQLTPQAALLFPRCGKRSVLTVKIDRITHLTPVIRPESILRRPPAASCHSQPAEPSHFNRRSQVSPKPGTTQKRGVFPQRRSTRRDAGQGACTRPRTRREFRRNSPTADSPQNAACVWRFPKVNDWRTCISEILVSCLDSLRKGHHPRWLVVTQLITELWLLRCGVLVYPVSEEITDGIVFQALVSAVQ